MGHTVQRYREVCAQFTDFFNVVLGFASQRPEVLENIARINREHPVYAPDIPVAGVGLFTREYAAAHRAEIELFTPNWPMKRAAGCIIPYCVTKSAVKLITFTIRLQIWTRFFYRNFASEPTGDFGGYGRL